MKGGVVAERVIVNIDPNGNTTVEVDGVVGLGCKKLTADIEKALGKVTSTTLKPEYHRKPQEQVRRKA
jgi:hypothetical protein